jgi:hypothetical protein
MIHRRNKRGAGKELQILKFKQAAAQAADRTR